LAVTAGGAGTRPNRRSIECANHKSHGSQTRTNFPRADRSNEPGLLTEIAFDRARTRVHPKGDAPLQ
jgi:hypothetical protein